MPAWSCLQFHSIQCLIAYFIRDNRRGNGDPRDRAAHYHINAPALVQGSRATSNAHQILPTLAPFLLPRLLVPPEKKHKQNFWLMSLGRRTISLNGCNKKLTTFGAQRAVPWRQWYISPFSDLRLGRRDPRPAWESFFLSQCKDGGDIRIADKSPKRTEKGGNVKI